MKPKRIKLQTTKKGVIFINKKWTGTFLIDKKRQHKAKLLIKDVSVPFKDMITRSDKLLHRWIREECMISISPMKGSGVSKIQICTYNFVF